MEEYKHTGQPIIKIWLLETTTTKLLDGLIVVRSQPQLCVLTGVKNAGFPVLYGFIFLANLIGLNLIGANDAKREGN